MMTGLLLLQILIFSITLWFGCYLLARDIQKQGLRYAGLGLVTYAIGLAWLIVVEQLMQATPLPDHWRLLPILPSSIFWMASTWYLAPETAPIGGLGLRWVGVLGVILLANIIIPSLTEVILMTVPLIFLLIAIWKVWQVFKSDLPRSPLITLISATLFFILGTGLMVIPLNWLNSEWVLLAISVDLILLGAVLGYLDAYEEGTNLLGDAMRSGIASFFVAGLFGGQVAMIMQIVDSDSPYLVALLFTVIATAIALESFAGLWQSALDRMIFIDQPKMQAERQVLRSVNAALPRINPTVDWQQMDDAEFARLTRRALSHFNDLDKLAASPLIHLPLVTQLLQQQSKTDTVLERSHLLKAVLAESILKLKPSSDQDFDTGDAWRYYNVLYFPYLRGLKPHSHLQTDWDEATRAAWEWFQGQVPERTLYNWQTTASRLVAQHLREMQHEPWANGSSKP